MKVLVRNRLSIAYCATAEVGLYSCLREVIRNFLKL